MVLQMGIASKKKKKKKIEMKIKKTKGIKEIQINGNGNSQIVKKLFYLNSIRPFAKLRKLTNWQLADCNRQINCNHPGPETDFFMGFRDIIHFHSQHKIIVQISN